MPNGLQSAPELRFIYRTSRMKLAYGALCFYS